MKKVLATSLVAFALAGCGGGATPPGPDGFVAWARGHKLTGYNTQSASAPDLLIVGNGLCKLVSISPSAEDAARNMFERGRNKALPELKPFPSIEETRAFVEASVVNLCPDQKTKLP